MEWVEVSGKTVDIAVAFGLKELGLESREQAEIEVLSEGEKGFLGMGGRDAVVRLKPKPTGRKRRRRRKGKKPATGPESEKGPAGGADRRQPKSNQGSRGDEKRERGNGNGRGSGSRNGNQDRPGRGRHQDGKRESKKKEPSVPTQEQADVVRDFLGGLVSAFGLEGSVDVRIDDETLIAEVLGDQTEAMVGPRGSVIEAIHEITKTVLLRRTGESARLRLDIAGHAERRRQALEIYANQLIDQVLEEGGEIVLEPMSAADRKVIHDAAAARGGVKSYSEGEAPRRYVVLASDSSGVRGDDEDEATDDHTGDEPATSEEE